MRRGRRNGLITTAAAVVALVGLASLQPAVAVGPFAPSGRVTVTPAASNQFAGTLDEGSGSREFTARHGAPPDGGSGALELRTPGDGDKRQYVTDEVAGPLSRFTDASYWAYRDPASSSGAMPSFAIAVDVNGGTLEAGDLYVLTYLPDRAPAGTWTRYDVGSGTYCTTQQIGRVDAYRQCRDGGEQRTLSDIMAAYPDMTAYAAGFNQGGGDAGLVSAVDLLRVGGRTYDFEPG
ncbi:hypothetical protein [Pseudonocardia alni]|uniref:hypothetical protein n=1 Tax=Pseudonocardia alni TaxID=33907 RepID=UPI00280BD7C9|nr:hypothetical protein [Pseudonocardia alni]